MEKRSSSNKVKYLKLIAAIIIDIIGYASYAIPAFAEGGDVIWGPISGVLIWILFPHYKRMAIVGAAEELVPFTDFVPTATIAWFLEYYMGKKKDTLKDKI